MTPVLEPMIVQGIQLKNLMSFNISIFWYANILMCRCAEVLTCRMKQEDYWPQWKANSHIRNKSIVFSHKPSFVFFTTLVFLLAISRQAQSKGLLYRHNRNLLINLFVYHLPKTLKKSYSLTFWDWDLIFDSMFSAVRTFYILWFWHPRIC